VGTPGHHDHRIPAGLGRLTLKLAIFDLDDTLIDFAATRQVAHTRLSELLDREGVDSAAFLRACSEVDRPLFSLFEQGKLSRAEYRLKRFSQPFESLGLAPQGDVVARLNKLFMDCVNDSPLLHGDAHAVLARLRSQDVRTAILTNGPSDGQRRKLRATGLGEAVDYVAIGEEIGFSKPSPTAFHRVVEQFSLNNADALMIGDSPELDYDAALGAGLTAVLLDREDRHRHTGRSCIRSLEALPLP
jgi:putative hydrolase of the HAD superfamily